MTLVKPTTKEQLIYFLLQNVSLGTYDRRFLCNLQAIHSDRNQVTTNQSDLLDKIIGRYQKQLHKKEIDSAEMISLPWTTKVVNSLPEFTHAFVAIEDDIVTLRSPFKKEFVNEFRETEATVSWDKETRTWSSPLSEESLKHFITMSSKHYDNLHYCEQTTQVINYLLDFETAKVWDPTLHYINGNILIAGLNKSLGNAIEDVKFEVSLKSIVIANDFGILIDESFSNAVLESLRDDPFANEKVEFAKTNTVGMDVNNPDKLVEFLHSIECDYVVITESYMASNDVSKRFINILRNNNFVVETIDKRSDISSLTANNYKMPVAIYPSMWISKNRATKNLRVTKSITLANSREIQIK